MITRDTSSHWMTDDFLSQLLRGRSLIVYGNVLDQVLLNGEYMSLSEFLNRYFREAGFEAVLWYDIVDGARLADPNAMQAAFSRATASCSTGNGCASAGNVQSQQSGMSPSGALPTASRTETPWSSAPEQPRSVTQPTVRPATSVRAPALQTLQTPEQVLPVVRQALRQTEIPAAVIIDFADRLFTDPKQQIDSERQMIILLKKITREAAYVQQGRLQGRKNCLVMVAENLAAVPPWLYQANPFLSLVHLPKPGPEERGHFIRGFHGNFHEGEALRQEASEDDRRKVFEQFSDNTDGLTLWDLDTILRMSRAEKISIREPKKLIRQFKVGRQDNPWEKLDPSKIRDARPRLEKRVIGQPHAMEAVGKMLACAVGGISCSSASSKGGQPRVLFCCGPTGVGKTELAKALTELLYGEDTEPVRFDMSEYRQDHSDQRLIGPPPGYEGHEQGGQLTNRCVEKPFSLFLFDEIDKAHPRVLDLFLQVLEDGRLTDGRGKTAFFSEACLMFTSNIGGSTLGNTQLQKSDDELPDYAAIRKYYLNEVRHAFVEKIGRPELLNRFGGNIVVFDIIRPEHMPAICRKFFALCDTSAKELHGIRLEWDDRIVEMICGLMRRGENFEMGGRRIKTLIEELVLPVLNQWVVLNRPGAGQVVNISAEEDGRILINGKASQ